MYYEIIKYIYFVYVRYRHAVFYAATSDDILDGFKLSHADLPLIYMIAEDSGNLLQYSGEILEIKLSDWVLKNSSPSMSELTLSSSAGKHIVMKYP